MANKVTKKKVVSRSKFPAKKKQWEEAIEGHTKRSLERAKSHQGSVQTRAKLLKKKKKK